MLTKEQRKDFNGLIIDGVQTYEDDLVTHDLCVTGAALLKEDLEADNIEISGSADVRGLVTCDSIHVEGRLQCGYSLVVDSGEINGRLKVSGKINAETLSAYGRVTCRSSAKIYELDIAGEFSCLEKLRSEKITVMGSLWVDGSIRTQRLAIDSFSKSYADEIVADSIVVKMSSSEKGHKQGNSEETDYLLSCTEVDCDKANICYTKIRTLYCTRAHIGPGCVIDEIFCKKEMTVSPQATVGKVVYL